MTEPDNALMLSILKGIQADLSEVKAELKSQGALLVKTADYALRLERNMLQMEQRLSARIDGLRDELELMLKAELMGRLAHFETRMEQRIDALSERDKSD